jgi:hypothetical protein
MADWTDGPEYAPTQRPTAFVAPAAEELAAAAPVPVLESGVVGEEPSFTPPAQATPDLRTLTPATAPERNPKLPFESATTALTTITASATDRSPEEPFAAPSPALTGYLPVEPVIDPSAQLNPAGFPSAPLWVGPNPNQPPAPTQSSTTIGEALQETTAWVLVPLVIGMFAWPISPLAFVVAWVASAQIRYRRVAVRRGFLIAAMLIAGVWLISVVADASLGLWDTFATVSLIGCWSLTLITPLIVWNALRNQEPPQQR